MFLSPGDWQALWLTARLAMVSTAILLLICTPLAWWLARSRSVATVPVAALVALPLVLPPTVIGFYLLLALSPDGLIGGLAGRLGIGSLAFTFAGLVLGSVIYSLPFVVQPLRATFASIDQSVLHSAATLGAGPVDRFFSVVLPMGRPGFLAAAVLGFAHTVGEFGVVLMIGGSIPGRTRVASIQLYDHVEALAYPQAHALAAVLIVMSLALLLVLYAVSPRWARGRL